MFLWFYTVYFYRHFFTVLSFYLITFGIEKLDLTLLHYTMSIADTCVTEDLTFVFIH